MKKILILSQVFYPENSLLNDFALTLSENGCEVSVLVQHPSYPFGKVFTGYQNSHYKKEKWEKIDIHRFKVIEGYKESKVKKILNYIFYVRKAKQILSENNLDFDHILVYQVGPLSIALPAIYYSKKKKIPLTIWTFDIWPDTVYGYGIPKIFPIPVILERFVKYVYSKCDNVLVSSKLFIESIQKYVPNKQIIYAPNWLINQESSKSEIEFEKDKFHFTFTGNISISQNLEKVLLGWSAADINHAILNIVGDGSSLQALEALVSRNSIKNVKFWGWVESKEINDILNKSDALVMSLISSNGVDRTEPFKLQSYIYSGKPILGAMYGAGRAIIQENEIGECSSPDDINEIADKFKMIYGYDSNQLISVKNNCLDLIKSRFDRNKIIEEVTQIIFNN